MAQVQLPGGAHRLLTTELARDEKRAVWKNAATIVDRAVAAVAATEWEPFTPSWGNLTVGNGTQSARFVRVQGGMWVRGYVIFGSSTSVSGSLSLTLPDSATMPSGLEFPFLGQARMRDSGTATFSAAITWNNTTSVTFIAPEVSATYLRYVNTSASIPFTWTTGDALSYMFFAPLE